MGRAPTVSLGPPFRGLGIRAMALADTEGDGPRLKGVQDYFITQALYRPETT